MEATLTSRGQLTVPKPIRDQLRLHAGDRLEFLIRENGHIDMIPKKGSMRELKGMAAPPVTGVTLDDMERATAKGACGDVRD
jgi:antitoxin PrlF